MGYYLLAGLGSIVTSIGYLCIYERVRIVNFGINLSWKFTEMLTTVSEYLGVEIDEERYIVSDDEYLEESDPLLMDINTFIKYYNIEENASYNINYNDKEEIEKEKERMDVKFLKTKKNEKIFYFRLDNLDNLDEIKFNEVEKTFLQVELINKDNNEIIDIHRNLDKFYIEDNKILDTKFLKWYVSYFYKKNLPENYKLRIFDKDINMITLEKDDYIKITKDGYNKYN